MSSLEDVMASVTQITTQLEQLTGNSDVQRFQQFNNTYAQSASLTGDTVSGLSAASVGPALAAMNAGAASGSVAWAAANRAIFVPFYITAPRSVFALFASIGTTSSGNLDIGVYNSSLMKVVSTGSVAMGSSSALQVESISQVQLAVGKYYMALAVDNTTATITRIALTGVPARVLDIYVEGSAFPLPASATFSTTDTLLLPVFGIALTDNGAFQ